MNFVYLSIRCYENTRKANRKFTDILNVAINRSSRIFLKKFEKN